MTPNHIAIIPDGNRRWAKNNKLEAILGHTRGSNEVLPDLIRAVRDAGVPYFTFWTTSTENLQKRPQHEVEHLLHLMRDFLKTRVDELHAEGARILSIGNNSTLPDDIQEGIAAAKEKTKNNTAITTIFAINYGGRDEILRAIKAFAASGAKPETLNQKAFSGLLDTAGIPDPDLIIRTGGEQRLSGFMLWQSEYSEVIFRETLFPDFDKAALTECIAEFESRQRRFGK